MLVSFVLFIGIGNVYTKGHLNASFCIMEKNCEIFWDVEMKRKIGRLGVVLGVCVFQNWD